MELQSKCEEFVKEIIESCKLMENFDLNLVRKNTLDFITDAFNEKIKKPSVIDYIAADNAVVEIVDGETGLCFRRELPLRFEETGNGVSLIGEDVTGKASQISFLSQAAYDKIKDLTGKGPEAPQCKDH